MMIGICKESDCDGDDDDYDDLSDLEGAAPIPKCQRLGRGSSGPYSDVRDCPSYLIQVKIMSLHWCIWFGQHLCVN